MQILNDFSTSVEKALSEIYPEYKSLPGMVICGTHNPRDTEALILLTERAREEGIPFLGICFGHQICAIEYARNVLGIKDATSEEFGVPGTFVVKKLPELKVGLHDGETYWNNYEVDLPVWNKPDNMITVQYHPEYQSSKGQPHAVLVEFLEKCKRASKRDPSDVVNKYEWTHNNHRDY